jgi:hypothetical protein
LLLITGRRKSKNDIVRNNKQPLHTLSNDMNISDNDTYHVNKQRKIYNNTNVNNILRKRNNSETNKQMGNIIYIIYLIYIYIYIYIYNLSYIYNIVYRYYYIVF